MRVEELFEQALKGDTLSISRLISYIEYPSREGTWLLSRLLKRAGKAHVIGITGSPGSGKSTLISRLIEAYRKRGERVAVVAVDPSSPFTQGALMGDRIRMQKFATDPGVFIRSFATRGERGGISTAALLTVEAFDGLGYNRILLETVGVGQVDVDIMHAAHTILVLTAPGTGDEIQALKAGLMEIGDIYVVNKADRPGATETLKQLEFAIEGGIFKSRSGWKPVALKVSAALGEGVDELVKVIDEHIDYITKNSIAWQRVEERRIHALKSMVLWLIEARLEDLLKKPENSKLIEGIVKGDIPVYTAAVKLLEMI